MSARVIVTAEHLKRKAACQSDRRRFKRLFGNEASITKTNLRKAARAGMSVGWFFNAFYDHNFIGGDFRCTCRSVCCESKESFRAASLHNAREVDRVWPKVKKALPRFKERLAEALA